jgi:hypothetical protein
MIVRLFVIAVVWSLVFALAACSPDPSGKTLSFDASEKVCQLTGDKDWDNPEADTTAQTSKFGLVGTDLGYPVEHNGQMALLFGDSRITPSPTPDKSRLPDESGPPDDAIGWVSTHTPPTKDRCLDFLKINLLPVVGPPSIKQGLFNVPTGGVSSNGFLYAFFWTDHCLHPDDAETCPEFGSLNKWGRGVLARSIDGGKTFVDPVSMPRDFVYSTAVDSEAAANLPAEQRIGIYVFGVPRYRHSVPYLAYAPPGTIGDPSAWLFFIGRKPDGQPSWTSREVWERRARDAPPPGQPDLFDASGSDRCVGEFSVTWNRALHAWLLLYNSCNPSGLVGQVVIARVAAAPWGPWSRGSILLDPNRDQSWCHLLWQVRHVWWQVPGKGKGCDDRHKDDWLNTDKAGKENGDFYAPYVMERYTTPEQAFRPWRRRATIYWLLSTWNPYQVAVMKTSLTIDESWPTIRSFLEPRKDHARPFE